MSDCVFCLIADHKAPALIVHETENFMAFVPLNPVTDGHLLVIPRAHYQDAADDPFVAGLVAGFAAHIATPPYNLIVNCGEEASQTVFHLHWHIVPRRKDDGLLLPWTNQEA